MENYNENIEKNLLDMKKQKEEADKWLLIMEIIIGVLDCLLLFGLIFVAEMIEMAEWLKILVITSGFILFMIVILFAVKIEQIAGYYECGKCHYKYVPKYLSVFCAMHIGRTRYMKCPECNKKSWNKKRISKE